VVSVLLTASDETVGERLSRREIGASLEEHLRRSKSASALLEARASASTIRLATDARPVAAVAAEVLVRTTWACEK
jgi:hypothetical protein